MGIKSNEDSGLKQFKKFMKNVILKLQNYQLKRINPIFKTARYSVRSCGTDRNIFDVINPDSTTSKGSTIQLKFLPDGGVHEEDLAKHEGHEFCYWIALLKEGVMVKQDYILVDNKIALETDTKILRLEQAPFYVGLFCEAAKESLQRPLVFIDDRLPLGLLVDVYTRYDYKNNKESNLREIAERLFHKVNKNTKHLVEYECRNRNFKDALLEILKLSKQCFNVDFSYCLACGTQVAVKKMFCNSQKTHDRTNSGNCRDKFHNWLRRRLNISGLEKECIKRDRLYEELQKMISNNPFSAFDTFRDKHPELYNKRRTGPKKKPSGA